MNILYILLPIQIILLVSIILLIIKIIKLNRKMNTSAIELEKRKIYESAYYRLLAKTLSDTRPIAEKLLRGLKELGKK